MAASRGKWRPIVSVMRNATLCRERRKDHWGYRLMKAGLEPNQKTM